MKKARGIELIGQIHRGEVKVEKIFQNDGQIVRAEVNVAPTDVIHAGEFLRDTAYGKPPQAVIHADNEGNPLPIVYLPMQGSGEAGGIEGT